MNGFVVKKTTYLLFAFVASSAYAVDPGTSPLVSGKLVLIHNHEQPIDVLLAPDQLKRLSDWWNEELADWTRDYATASSAPEFVEMKLKHANDIIDEVAFKSSSDGRHFAELRTGRGGCGQWPGGSFCNQNETRWRTKSLSSDDLKAFWKAVNIKFPPGNLAVFP